MILKLIANCSVIDCYLFLMTNVMIKSVNYRFTPLATNFIDG